jgi:hypothetical protein
VRDDDLDLVHDPDLGKPPVRRGRGVATSTRPYDAGMAAPAPRGGPLVVGYRRAILAPLAPLVLLLAAIVAGRTAGAVVLVVLLVLVVAGIAVRIVTSPPVVIDGTRLAVRGREDRRRAPGGAVDLQRLDRATSVSYRGGLVSGRGLALFRSFLDLTDTAGGEAMFWAWGWSARPALQEALREAVDATGAAVDALTAARLGLVPRPSVSRWAPARRGSRRSRSDR